MNGESGPGRPPQTPTRKSTSSVQPADPFDVAYVMGYLTGVESGHRAAEAAVIADWKPVATWVRGLAQSESYDELSRRREVGCRQPCPQRCRRCSRCIGSMAYWRRGGRDWPGVVEPVPW